MKKLLVRGLLAWALFACGGADQTDLTTDTDTEALPEGAVPSTAVLIDEVNWGGETLGFFDASTPDDEVPAILVSQLGKNSNPELDLWLGNHSKYPVTPAELWRAATGDDQVPDELMAQHRLMAMEDGRPTTELQNFDLTEKAGFPNVTAMFPLDANSTGVFTTPHCWANGGIRVVTTGPGTPSNSYSTCSSNGTAIRNFAIDGGCDPILNQNTTVRTMAYNGSTFPLSAKYCFAAGNAVWQCVAPKTLNFDFFFGASFFKNGTKHRMGSGFSVSTSDTIQHASSYLATATLADGLARFEDTGCTAFSENFRRP